MKNALAVLLFLAVVCCASWSIGQDVDEAACQKTIQISCTSCHGTDLICDKLDDKDANWPDIIKVMGEEGDLSQEIQDKVLNCLTMASDPKKMVCEKMPL